MKKIVAFSMALLVFGSGFIFAGGKADKAKEGDQKTIVFTSWRTEDIDKMARVNSVFEAENPDIKVDFQPIKNTEYDTQLKSSLATGVAADIMYLRSYDGGRQIYDTGKLLDLNSVVPALANFPSAPIGAWSTEEGLTYAVPTVGVTHGIYYSKAIFDKYGFTEPETWAEFMSICAQLKENGETVFAQGTKDGWCLYEVIFSGLGPNFYGGEQARQDLMAGKVKLTDPQFVKAFERMNDLTPYFPKGYEGIDYVSMQNLFGAGRAAMYIGGSWEIDVFANSGMTDEKVGYFPPPVENKGDQLSYCFHVDAGTAVNKDSKNLEAAKKYINWIANSESAELIMGELPGFFSYVPGDYNLSNKLAKDMMDAVAGSDVTVRTLWEKLSAQAPSGYTLIVEGLTDMFNGKITPEQAAEHVQRGLDTWYKP